MKSRIILLILLLGIIDLTIFSCCPDSKFEFTKISSITLTNYSLDEDLIDITTVIPENFRLKLYLNQEYIAANKIQLKPLNTSFATSCDNEDGISGLKNNISTIEITASKDFIGTPAGENLNINNQILIYQLDFEDIDEDNIRKTIQETIDILNTSNPYRQEYYLEFQSEITTTEPIKFFIKLIFEDETFILAETNNVEFN